MILGTTSCSKDDKNDTISGTGTALTGTTWQCVETLLGVTMTRTIVFREAQCEMSYTYSEIDQHSTATYTYEGTLTEGHGKINLNNNEGAFTVNGEQMTLSAEGTTKTFNRITK